MSTVTRFVSLAAMCAGLGLLVAGCGGGAGTNTASVRVRVAEPLKRSRSDAEVYADITVHSFVNASVQKMTVRVPVKDGTLDAELRCPAAPTALELELHNATFSGGGTAVMGFKVLVPGFNEMLLFLTGHPEAAAAALALDLMRQAPDMMAQAGSQVWSFVDALAHSGVTTASEAIQRIRDWLGS